MAQAFKALANGNAINPLRNGILLPDRVGVLGMMPGYLGEPEAMGLKVVAVFPGNHGTEYDSHQGVVMLFDMEHGLPVAILDASEVTAIRTAAATGVATRVLARPDAAELAVLGTGVQARTHVEAMMEVRPIHRVRVYSRDEDRRRRFAEVATQRHEIEVVATDSARDAVAGADIVCTTTSAPDPVLFGDWLEPGMHINAVGSSVKHTRELDTAAVVRSRLFVDRRESTVNEAGDYLMPLAEGAITDEHIVGEIGDLLTGRLEGRQDEGEITLFKSLGLAIEDLAAARHVYQAARHAGVGTPVDLGGTV